MVVVVAAIADTSEISTTANELHLIRKLIGESLLHIEGFATIDMQNIRFGIERTGKLYLVGCGTLNAGLRIPFASIKAERTAMAPLLIKVVVASVDVGSPRL